MADFTIKRNDTAPAIVITLEDASGAADVSTAKAMHLFMKCDQPTLLVKTGPLAKVTDGKDGKIEYAWADGDLKQAGTYRAEVEVTRADDTVQTFPNDGYFEIEVVEDLGQPGDLE
jgi:hypothetical protein